MEKINYSIFGIAGYWHIRQDGLQITGGKFKTREQAREVIAFMQLGYTLEDAEEKSKAKK